MSVLAAKGFVGAGVSSGLKASGGLDLALIVNRGPEIAAAAVFTTNRCLANPIIWSKQVIADGTARAIILNSGGANCYTGPQGFQTTHATAEKVAELLGDSASDVLVCSTGLIGEQLDRDKLCPHALLQCCLSRIKSRLSTFQTCLVPSINRHRVATPFTRAHR